MLDTPRVDPDATRYPLSAAGLRRATPDTRRAIALADGYRGLPDGVTRWRLAAALRAAARSLALSNPMLRLLEHYIDLTYDQDWAADSEPVVTRPLIEIAEYLGRSERQVRNIEHALVARGLLAWRDSGNHHRKGRRDRESGRLVYAYGPSLAPLGARAAEILAVAASARAAAAAARRLRLGVSSLRRRLRAELAAGAAQGVDMGDLTARFEATPPRMPAGLSLAELSAQRDALIVLAQAVENRLGGASGEFTTTNNISGKPEKNRSHETDTSKKYTINGSIANEQAKAARDITNSDGATEQHSHDADVARADNHGLIHLPLALVLQSAGATTQAMLNDTTGTQGWARLVAAAQRTALMLQIDQTLWAEACARLGRHGAAVAVILVERGAERAAGQAGAAGGPQPIKRPAAYLRALLARADAGALHLDRSVRAWAARGPHG